MSARSDADARHDEDVDVDPVHDTDTDTYGIVVPEDWINVPLDPNGFDAMVARLRGKLAEQPGWDRAADRRLDVLATQLRNDLLSERVRIAAICAIADKRDAASAVLVAGVTVSRIATSELAASVTAVSVETLRAGLSAPPSSDRESVTDVDRPSVVRLGHAGDAVRLKRVYERRVSPLECQRVYSQSYVVPHDEGRSLCVLQFATSTVEAASLLDRLFEAIAQTLRLFGPDDPTDFS